METKPFETERFNIQGQFKAKVLKSLFNFWGATPYGGVAQLGEHLLCKQGVIGSIPFISTRGQGKNTAEALSKWAHSSGG